MRHPQFLPLQFMTSLTNRNVGSFSFSLCSDFDNRLICRRFQCAKYRFIICSTCIIIIKSFATGLLGNNCQFMKCFTRNYTESTSHVKARVGFALNRTVFVYVCVCVCVCVCVRFKKLGFFVDMALYFTPFGMRNR